MALLMVVQIRGLNCSREKKCCCVRVFTECFSNITHIKNINTHVNMCVYAFSLCFFTFVSPLHFFPFFFRIIFLLKHLCITHYLFNSLLLIREYIFINFLFTRKYTSMTYQFTIYAIFLFFNINRIFYASCLWTTLQSR